MEGAASIALLLAPSETEGLMEEEKDTAPKSVTSFSDAELKRLRNLLG